ncbi:MAG: hypothetical protein WDZ56_01340 [Candidatus Paceibacterota bacterium]
MMNTGKLEENEMRGFRWLFATIVAGAFSLWSTPILALAAPLLDLQPKFILANTVVCNSFEEVLSFQFYVKDRGYSKVLALLTTPTCREWKGYVPIDVHHRCKVLMGIECLVFIPTTWGGQFGTIIFADKEDTE